MSLFDFDPDDIDEDDLAPRDELTDDELAELYDEAPYVPAVRRVVDVPISIDDYPPAPKQMRNR